MEPFRSTRGGGARAWLAEAEASLLRSLVGQVMSLVEPEGPGQPQSQAGGPRDAGDPRSEEHTSELQSHLNLVCRLLLQKKKNPIHQPPRPTLVDRRPPNTY